MEIMLITYQNASDFLPVFVEFRVWRMHVECLTANAVYVVDDVKSSEPPRLVRNVLVTT